MEKIYKTSDVRRAFLDYFERHSHTVVASSSLVPGDDPTLFFTNAGMVQFKGVFLGQEKRKYTRAVTAQRCLRASGKHNDLEIVGHTNRHHTFFEMLGNFSFGDYFKQDAIHYAWEFLTKELGIDSKKLWVTRHQKDQEAEHLWQEEFKRSHNYPQGISQCGDRDNFWSMGETGPCGYCSEIFYDHGAELPGDPPGGKDEGERYVEIWNLVFMQFNRDQDGRLIPLPKPSIDTGMGLERIAAVMQGVYDNYAIDVFAELRRQFNGILTHDGVSSQVLASEDARIALRVVVDHIRSAVFLIADGVFPANEKTGYVLRSIIRRAVYHLYGIGVQKPLFFQLVRPLVAIYADIYPDLQLATLQEQIATTIEQEEIKFLDTLDRGLKILADEIAKLPGKIIPGEIAFNLHDTYGLPIILTTEIASKRGLTVDQAGFATAMEKQREASRVVTKVDAGAPLKLTSDVTTKFIGYTADRCVTKVCGLYAIDGAARDSLNLREEGIILLEQSPFYAESGGQIGDSGEIYSSSGVFVVRNTQKYSGWYLHYGSMVKGSLGSNAEVTAEVNVTRRLMIKSNHSATHLLHNSLRLVVGEHAVQRGSAVDNKRLRFDFNHNLALTAEDISRLEQMVNAKIRANLEVKTTIKSLDEAKSEGAFALFGEKYGDEVRVVTMGIFSKELCGGTHVNSTGEIGLFKVVSETGVAAGVRRIEAVTGENALFTINHMESELKAASRLLGVSSCQMVDRVKQLLEEKHLQEKELVRLKNEVMDGKNHELMKQVINIGSISILSVELAAADGKMLRQTVDSLKRELRSAVVVLATINEGKVQLVAGVTEGLLNKINANELLVYVTRQIDGSGGGRADMAQGGGINVEALQGALASVVPWVKDKLECA